MSTSDEDNSLVTLDALIAAAAENVETFGINEPEHEQALKDYVLLIDQRKKLTPEPAPQAAPEPQTPGRWAWTQHLIAPGFALIGTLAILGTEIYGHSAKQAWDEKKSIKAGR